MKLLYSCLRRRCLLQNYQNFQRVQWASIAHQFKVQKPIYYPNRQAEMQRIEEQQKSQLVAEPKYREYLPKDHYYKILGLTKNASYQQIKEAYYALAKRYHPDSPNSANAQQISKRFQEISNAYNILTDDSARTEYDNIGKVKNEGSYMHKTPIKKYNVSTTKLKEFIGMTHDPNAAHANSLKSIPHKLEVKTQLQANSSEHKLDLTFIESVHGVKKNIEFQFLKKCPSCNGKSQRMVGRINPEICRKCNGTGQLTKKTATYTSITVCDQCNGKRQITRGQCELCESRGFVQELCKVTVHVPAGVKSGDVISVENPHTNQRINYRLTVKESDYFKRVGNNVLTEKLLNLTDAILGGTIKVRGIYDTFEVKIDPGTESHTKVTIKGKGIKTRENVGDHILTLKVRIPRQLSMKQRQLILALAKTEEPTFECGG